MIMRGKKRPRLDFVVEKFRHAPGNGKSVEGRRAASDLIENDQAAFGGVVHDVGCLVHLHHEGRLTARQVVVRPDPRENAIDQADFGARGRHKTSDLRHQHNQSHLPNVGRFPRHIRPGHDGQSQVFAVQVGVVRNKFFLDQILIQHRVTAIFDDKAKGLIQRWPAVMEKSRRLRQPA